MVDRVQLSSEVHRRRHHPPGHSDAGHALAAAARWIRPLRPKSNVPTLRYLLRSCRRGRQPGIHAERVRVGRVVHVFEAIFPEARNDRRVTLRWALWCWSMSWWFSWWRTRSRGFISERPTFALPVGREAMTSTRRTANGADARRRSV